MTSSRIHCDMKSTSFNPKEISRPIVQAVLLAAGCLIVQIIVLLIGISTEGGLGYTPWIVSASFMLLYAFFNAILLLKAENMGLYVSQSSYCYIGMMLGTTLFAYAVSSATLGESGSIRWIYIIITVCYTIFMVIVFLMRKIIEYAQRQDTEHKG